MFNVFLLVMLICSVNVSKTQQFDSSAVNNQDLTSAPAAVIQGKDKARTYLKLPLRQCLPLSVVQR